jgi:biofilm PGA synthesis N-glycosyltransferase PgaC
MMRVNQELTLVPRASKRYISVYAKFILAHIFASLWTALSVYLSIPWMKDLAELTTLPVSIFIIGGLAYVPGYFNAILVTSLILDKQPRFKNYFPKENVTILIAARNEGDRIEHTLKYIAGQDYRGT